MSSKFARTVIVFTVLLFLQGSVALAAHRVEHASEEGGHHASHCATCVLAETVSRGIDTGHCTQVPAPTVSLAVTTYSHFTPSEIPVTAPVRTFFGRAPPR